MHLTLRVEFLNAFMYTELTEPGQRVQKNNYH